MNRVTAFCAGLVCSLMATPALADGMGPFGFSGFYLEGRGGAPVSGHPTFRFLGVTDDFEIDDAFSFAGAVGTYIMPTTRLEYEFWYVSSEDGRNDVLAGPTKIQGNADVFGHMVNILHEFHVDPSFIPYVGGGLGIAIYDVDYNLFGISITGKDTTFAAAVHAGIDVPLSNAFTFTTRYTLAMTTLAEFDTNVGGQELNKLTGFTHLLTAGVRINLQGLAGQ